ncbi:acyltransferase family protein [Nocardioides cynanchi]|uniref:acyltransferase family protein n=1 Tax=Nocardioides cynanchi TaxID=2558918 RepID=UPI001248E24F|nr:acyltransferase [Nocardioides cynanchi]
MSTTPAPWRLGHRPALDGLRGVAVVIVVADHTGYLPEPAGGIGVVVFFVLSGFLITRMIGESRDAGSWSLGAFVANRFVRLFPALALMVTVVSAVLLVQGFPVEEMADRAVPALTYVQNMEPATSFSVFGQTWSLGVEEQFYLAWPLVLPWVLGRARPRIVLAVAIAASAAAMIASGRDWLPMHAYALLAGCLLALVGPLRPHAWLVPAGALGLLVSIDLAPSLDRIYVYGPLVATPAAVLLVAGAVPGDRMLALAPLRFVGRISYAVYLWHVPLLRLTGTTYGRADALLPIAVAVALAIASTLVVEEPLRRAWRASRTTSQPATHPTAVVRVVRAELPGQVALLGQHRSPPQQAPLEG